MVALASPLARAEPDGPPASWDASLRTYQDDDHVLVISPAARIEAPLAEGLRGDVAARADIISAASVDVITQASPAVVEERRIEVGVGASLAASRLAALSLRAIVSHENDYDSLRVVFGSRLEFAQHNTTLDLLCAAGADQVGHARDPTFARARYVGQGVATLTQTLDPLTYADLVVELETADGYHGSPYRTVPILDLASPAVVRVSEETPSGRHALSLLGRVRRALVRDLLFIHADYRFYTDTWDVKSHTLSGWVLVAPTKQLLLAVELRGYDQSAASFYRPRYYATTGGAPPAYRTRDRTLGGMSSFYGALSGELELSQALRVSVLLGLAHFDFWNFPPQSERTAFIASLGAAGQL